MVGHVIQEQLDTAGGQGGPGRGEPVRPAEGRVGDVAPHAVRRPYDVGGLQVGQGLPERRQQPGVRVRQG